MLTKLYRTATSLLPVSANRTGSCNGCGECCKLPFRCQFLKDKEGGGYTCSIYQFRPPNCRKFPRTAQDLKPVIKQCGFSFKEIKVQTIDTSKCES